MLGFLLLALAGSSSARPEPALVVAAAASVRPALEEIRLDYEKETGIPVTVSYGASGILARQIENGAPFDVFLSADTSFVDRLERGGHLLSGSRVIYARGTLVLVLSREAADSFATFKDLSLPVFSKIALANPNTAPYGRAAVESLRAEGLWPAISDRAVYADNVADVVRYVRSGDAAAGFAALSEAKDAGLRIVEIPESSHAPILQEACAIAGRLSPDRARAFVHNFVSEKARVVWARHGFSLP